MPLGHASVANHSNGPFREVVGNRHAADQMAEPQDLFGRERLGDGGFEVGRGLFDDGQFLVGVGIVDVHHEHEPVELRLGQRVGAFLLDGVLRGQHEERLGQGVPLAARR